MGLRVGGGLDEFLTYEVGDRVDALGRRQVEVAHPQASFAHRELEQHGAVLPWHALGGMYEWAGM